MPVARALCLPVVWDEKSPLVVRWGCVGRGRQGVGCQPPMASVTTRVFTGL